MVRAAGMKCGDGVIGGCARGWQVRGALAELGGECKCMTWGLAVEGHVFTPHILHL